MNFTNSKKIAGLHHVTAIAGDPQLNLDFYVGFLGLRLVKRTINFDDPGSYHFYFADAVGTPGTILTFFAWPGARRGGRGRGEVNATSLAIPPGSSRYWLERLRHHRVSAERAPKRFGEEVIRFTDPDGLPLELVESELSGDWAPWREGLGEHAIRSFHSLSAASRDPEETANLLTKVFGYRLIEEDANRLRFSAPGERSIGKMIDLVTIDEAVPARIAVGSVHHVAFRVSDDEEQIAWRERLVGLGYGVSPVMDRTYFRSIYFRETGGLLFELATTGPGFTLDEPIARLGGQLCLPPWMESARPRIEENLAKIIVPTKAN